MNPLLRSKIVTRRAYLVNAARAGVGLATLLALGPQLTPRALANSGPPDRVKVLVEDRVEATPADFGRGQADGVQVIAESGGAALRARDGGEFTSGPIEVSFPATHVGLHWVLNGGSPEALGVAVRTSVDGRSWSPWQSLHVEAVGDAAGDREVFAALVHAGRGRFVQYQVTFPPHEVATLRRMTVTAINSVDGPREPLAAAARISTDFSTPHASFTVITREGWGCDEGLRFRGRREVWKEMYVPAKRVIVHHTASPNGYADGAAEVRAIYTYHARTLGWGDVGYNILVDNAGNIYEGRHGRGEDPDTREILSADVVAGHVYRHNYGSAGIAAIGNFDEALPGAVLDAVKGALDELVTFECWRHYIQPRERPDFLQSDDAWHDGMNNVSGHYESDSTACPGTALKGYLDTLRQHVVDRLGTSAAPSWTSFPPSRELTEPATLSFAWEPGGAPYAYSLEGWYKQPDGDDITYLAGYAPGGYGDSLAMKQQWQETTGTAATFENLAAGHYTMHLRAGSRTYESNLTFLVRQGGGSSTKPGKGPKPR